MNDYYGGKMKTIYLIRHSKTGKNSFISRFYKPLNKNVRFSLGEEGRKIAEKNYLIKF